MVWPVFPAEIWVGWVGDFQPSKLRRNECLKTTPSEGLVDAFHGLLGACDEQEYPSQGEGLPCLILNQMGKKSLLRCVTHGARKPGEPVFWGNSLPETPGSKRAKHGCWGKERAEGVHLPSLEQGAWIVATSEPQQTCQPL